jgi:beta-fructofuranosidase
VLMVSPHGPVQYFVGDFDVANHQFKPVQRGILDRGAAYYAPNSLLDHRGRRLIWGWIRGFKPDQGWNGCLTLPRMLSLNSRNELIQKPVPELKKLRSEHFRLSDFTLEGTPHVISGVKGDCLEIYADIELLDASAVRFDIRCSEDGTHSIPISFNGNEVMVADGRAPFQLAPGEKTLKLHIFLDRSVVEVFANNRLCFAQVAYSNPQDLGIALSSSSGAARVRSFHAWKMQPIW